MTMGRPPKPTALKLIEGNPGKKKLPEHEPKPVSGPPNCPSWLPALAKSEWRRVIKELEALNLIHHIDRSILEGYCYWYAEWRKAAKFVEDNGFTYESVKKKGLDKGEPYVAQRPEVAIARNAFKEMRGCASEFGMGPASRSRIDVPWSESDEWDWLRKG